MIGGKLVVCLVGAILFAVGMYNSKKRRKFLREGKEITAEVVDYQAQMDNTWAYVLAYTPPGSKRIVAVDSVYHSNKERRTRKKIGEKLKIVYHPKKPMEFTLKNEGGLQMGFYLMMLAGIGFAVLGIFVIE